ncbi:hypothetical protein Syun_013930 [Stephania yunnanensis]|uniref:Uncharacterized protein n=1 Tax=Stephania yunnanensis TaxID=152371 RepID=A0AAP0JJ49_9MAGN
MTIHPFNLSFYLINPYFSISKFSYFRFEKRLSSSKDDGYLVPLHSRSMEFTEAHEQLVEGSVSDGGVASGNRPNTSKATASKSSTIFSGRS